MTRIILGIASALALAAVFPAAPAQAQNGTLTRSFVSSTGVDTNPCTITEPCATFAHAYTAIGANGIIAALDPGKYGPLGISSPVTVNGNGWAAITAPAQGTGIVISTSSGNVVLTGLEIDGAGAAYNGIVFNSGSSLTVTDCIVQNLLFTGLLIEPTSSGALSFTITNTTASNNGSGGISYAPVSGSATTNGVIDHVVVTNNTGAPGIAIGSQLGSGSATVAILNSIVSGNSATGITMQSSAPLAVSIDNTTVTSNGSGITAGGTTTVLLTRSMITANATAGVTNNLANNSPSNTFYSYLDNRISGNGTGQADDVVGTGLTSHAFK